jgi:cytochrome c-type biogenesis protein CcmH
MTSIRLGRRLARRLLAIALLAGLLIPGGPTALAGARSNVSFTGVESQLMCTACKESLAVAQSPAADAERQYLRDLIAQGLSQKQIMANMVAVYSPAVLARPPASGFNLTIYILPPAVLLIGLATLVYFLPRWRARARAAAAERAAQGAPPRPRLSPSDTARLDAELARSDGR